MKHRVGRVALVSGIGLVTAGAVLWAVGARGAGVPAANALTYTGYLETPEGAPVTAPVNVSIALWSAASAGTKACEAAAEMVTPVAGRFQITLPQTCTTAVKAQPDLWLETTVDGAALGRTKLGAVPYALEANHATSADSASASSGALATELTALKADVAALKTAQTALKARLDAPTTTTLSATKVRYDLTETAFTWISGTASTKLSPGRYWVYNMMRSYKGASAAASSGAYLSVCVRKAGVLEVLPSVVVTEVSGGQSLPTAVIDYVDIAADTNAVELGFCAKQVNETVAPTVLAEMHTMVIPLLK